MTRDASSCAICSWLPTLGVEHHAYHRGFLAGREHTIAGARRELSAARRELDGELVA